MLNSYWRRQRTDRTISVLTSIAAMIRSGTPITGTVNSQSGNPGAAISATTQLAAFRKRCRRCQNQLARTSSSWSVG